MTEQHHHRPDEDDDDYAPPLAVHVEVEGVTGGQCPVCRRPLVKHRALELMQCSAKQADEDEEEEDDGEELPAPPPPVHRSRQNIRDVPRPVGRAAENGNGSAVSESPLLPPGVPKKVELGADGKAVLNYEELAAAMKVVIERERDEVIKRGGPLEKQNLELKERLHSALEDANTWRRRAQANAEQRNKYKEQLDAQIKTNRQLRNEMSTMRKGGRPKVVEINDILRVVQQTPGFEVKRQGNGHYGIYKEGVWITDAASSGQGDKVDMATRVKLRKAGVGV